VVTYRRRSTRAAAEVAALQLERGWKAAAVHAAKRTQKINLALKDHERAPCTLRKQTVGRLKEFWMADRSGRDQRRPETVMILRQLRFYGLSKFEPNPQQAIELERERRQALTGPTPAA
jgi:hypothetical protein